MGKGKRNSLEQYERRGMIEVSSKIKERKLQGNYLQNLGACICRQKEIKNRSCSKINNGDIIVKFKDSISCDLVYNNRLKLKKNDQRSRIYQRIINIYSESLSINNKNSAKFEIKTESLTTIK